MKKYLLLKSILSLIAVIIIFSFTACQSTKKNFKVEFYVDENIYWVFDSENPESLSFPNEPTKENHTFEGWYIDNDTWEKPFTIDCLFTKPIKYHHYVYAKFNAKHNHILNKISGKQSTCIEAGFNDYWICECGQLFSDPNGFNEISEIPTLELSKHNWNGGIIIKQSSETEEGIKEFTCLTCNNKKSESIDKHYHQWHQDSIKIQASCNKTGITIHKCKICGLEKEEDIPALTHNYLFDKEIVKATCTVKGENRYKCKNCGDTKTEFTQLADHEFDSTWTIDKKAQCTEDGSKSHHCKHCDEKRDITVIEATGHNVITDKAVPATCSATGLTVGSHCETCNKVITPQKTINKTDHSFGNWITTNSPTYSSSGSKYRQCKYCNYKETETIPKLVADIKLSISISKSSYAISNNPTATYTTTMNNNNTYSVTVTVSWKQSYEATFLFNYNFNGTNTNTVVIKKGGSNTYSYTFNNIPTNVTKMSISITQR